MNGQHSYRGGYQKVSYRGGPGGWDNRGGWGHGHHPHHHHRPMMPGILMFLLVLFVLSKAWWLIFVIPGLFFWFAGSSGSRSWNCDTPKSVTVKAEKRKNDGYYGEEDYDGYYDEKPKRQTDQEYEII